MNFRTNIQLKKEANQIDYNSKLLLIGSCFSENIYNKLDYYKFEAFSNPFGILFNPIAIENLVYNAINQTTFTKNNIFNLNERWHCFNAHSDISAFPEDKILQNLNSAISSTKKQLKDTSHLIITLGTARVYKHIESNTVVGNCHKVPQKKFLQKLLSVEEIIVSLKNIITLVKTENPSTNILFTVSPVRHLKDGFVENTVSKAHLISAISSIVNPINNIYYFPSYEIMLDDLREYRFYKNDMIHPNELAINYIWEQFKSVWIHKKSASIMNEIEIIQKGLAHKPFNKNSKQHQVFLEKIQQKIAILKNKNQIIF